MLIYLNRDSMPTFTVRDKDRVESSSFSKGNQAKWCLNNSLWLKADFLGYEGLTEYVTSCLLTHSNIPSFVRYFPCFISNIMDDGTIEHLVGCYSDDFRGSKDIVTLLKYLDYRHNLSIDFKEFSHMGCVDSIKCVSNYISKDISSFGSYLTSMLELDAFILL